MKYKSAASPGEDLSLESAHQETLPARVSAHALSNPNAVAVISDGTELTYGELNRRANQVARSLQRLGAQAGNSVLMFLDDPMDQIIAAVAVMKSGAILVPVEPSEPSSRLALIVRDAGSFFAITKRDLGHKLPNEVPDASRLELDYLSAEKNDEGIPDKSTVDAVACLLYRSSPAGFPQAIAVRHTALLMSGIAGAQDRLALAVNFSDDLTFFEIFRTLGCGGCILNIPTRPAFGPRKLAGAIRERSVTLVSCEAALLEHLASDFPRELHKVRRFFCTDRWSALHQLKETVPQEIAERIWVALASAEGGGIYAMHPLARIDVHPGVVAIDEIPEGTTIHVLDSGLEPVAEGVIGELYIGGERLAQGYWADSQRTAGSFIAAPHSISPKAQLYRTGELARSRTGRYLELCGRRDGRTTFRGRRIEREEIEKVLSRFPGAKDCAVAVRDNRDRPEAEIVAFVVCAEGEPIASEVQQFLESKMPGPVPPLTLFPVAVIPRTTDGKVDRPALDQLEAANRIFRTGTQNYVAPRNPAERSLAEIWAQAFRAEKIGVYDNFFRHGGNSLLGTHIVALASEVFGIDLPVRSLFDAPTIAEQAMLIEQLKRSNTNLKRPIVPVPRDRALPLSFAQRRMWFLAELVPDNPFYSAPIMLRLDGPLDNGALERCLNEIVRRHEVLRTKFIRQGGDPVQIIDPSLRVPLQFVDLTDRPEAVRESESSRLVRDEARQLFSLSRGPLLRTLLVKLSEVKHLLLVTTHHIISDGWSIWVILHELAALYQAFVHQLPSPLPELQIQYADYAVWQREYLQGEILEQQLTYWKKQLEAMPGQLDLTTDRPRTTAQTFQGGRYAVVLSKRIAEGLKALSREEGSTLFMTLLAAFELLLGRHSGQLDFGIGVPIANRRHTACEGLIGFFVNTLVMRANLSGNPTFRELLERVRQTALGAYAHQDLPFEKLVEELQPERDLSRTPLFQVAFAYEEGMTLTEHAGELQLTTVDVNAGITQFDLVTRAFEVENGLEVRVEYATDLFDESTIARMLGHYSTLLEQALAHRDNRSGELLLLTEAERTQIASWSQHRGTYSPAKCAYQLFAEQAARTPKGIAVSYEGEHLTYAQLNSRANQLAHYLRGLGIGPEKLVGICMERSLDMVVGLLGILKAGGAYLPLDPHYPADRLQFMLQDAKAPVLLTSKGVTSVQSGDARVVILDDERAAIAQSPDDNPPITALPENLAYLIYTSGSTGMPKGVPIPHGNITRLLTATEEWFNFGATDVWTLFHSYAFDFSVWELWGALAYGGRLVIVPQDVSRSPEDFYKLLVREHVTVLNQTPSAFRQLSRAEETLGQQPINLRLIIFGGEALEIGSLRSWFERHGDNTPQLVNMYGITETTVHVSYRPVSIKDVQENAGSVIGTQIPDLDLHILDQYAQPVPISVAGEIYVGGAGLARGYLGRPELTAQRFVPDPFSGQPGARLYRSGDRARRLVNGDIEFLGRVDRQVKIRGFRIELGEIEAVLQAHPAVEEAIAMLRTNESGDKRLIAWVVPSKQRALPLLQLLRMEKQGGLRQEAYELPNGRTILHHRRNETEFLYKEVFEDQGYFRHGIHIPEGGCIFDVGANIGMFTLFAGWSAERARVYAFEPIPEIFEVLENNIMLYGLNAHAFNCGLGREARTETFTYYPNLSIVSGAHGNIEEEHEVVKSFVSNQLTATQQGASVRSSDLDDLVADRLRSEQINCSIKTISQVIREEKVDTVDLLKIDVEKSELDVLEGIEEGDWGRIRQAVVEVHDKNNNLNKIIDLFRKHGFDITTEQDASLTNTNLFTVYATRETDAGPEEMQECKVRFPAMWTSVGQLTTDLRERLQQKLPHYMVPAAIMVMDCFPLTANGKVNREALPWMESQRPDLKNQFRSPRTALEEALVGLWSEILGVQKIGIEDNWFDLGGHSLLATQLISRMRTAFQIDLPVRTLFEAPTVRALAERAEAKVRAGRIEAPPIQRHEFAEGAPLSFAQERLWFLDQLQPGGFVYNVPIAARITGQLNIEALQKSIRELANRHDVLRTRFLKQEGTPVQVVQSSIEIPFAVIDLSQAPEAERQQRLSEFIREEVRRPFDLGGGVLFRASLIRLGAEEHLLIMNQHHIVSDAWSLGVLWREVGMLYESYRTGNPPCLEPLTIQYSDYAIWQRESAAKGALEESTAYWKKQLEGMRGILEVPADHQRPAVQSSNGTMLEFSLDSELCNGLKELSRREGVTLFMTLVAGFNALLHRFTGETDIAIGSPIANRVRPELEQLIGFFVNTLVLRTNLSGNPAFRQLLGRIREVSLGAYTHQDMPFEKLVEQLQPERDLSHTPLFQVVFAYQNTPIADYSAWHSVRLSPEPIHLHMGIAKFDLTLSLEQTDSGAHGFLEYNTDLFEEASARNIVRRFEILLRGAVHNSDLALSALPLLDAGEREVLTRAWQGPELKRPSDPNIAAMVAARASHSPHSVALITDGAELSYGELNRRANQMGRHLLSLGIRPGEYVGVCVERAADWLITVLAIIKAGGAFVPLSGSDPAARTAFLLADFGARHVITVERMKNKFAQWAGEYRELVYIDHDSEQIEKQSCDHLAIEASPEGAACLLYRSAVSGHPEGIVFQHRSLMTRSFGPKLGLREADRLAQSLSFFQESTCLEAFTALASGACIVDVGDRALVSPRKLAALLKDHGATVLWTSAGSLERLVREFPRALNNVRLVFCDDSPSVLQALNENLPREFARRVYATHGTAETGGCCIIYPLEGVGGRGSRMNPAQLAEGMKVYILDAELQPVPVGVPGEICVSGDQVGFEYLHQRTRSAHVFADDPFSPGHRLCRTGDWAWLRPDGSLELRGRRDRRTAINGFRVECDEIEQVLRDHPSVHLAAVQMRKENGVGKLLAYWTRNKQSEQGVEGNLPGATKTLSSELQAYLGSQLPEYMIPATLMELESLPVKANGTLDYAALPMPGTAGTTMAADFVAPRNDTEQMIAAVWCELLDIKEVGIHNNFFDMGGHSFLITRLQSRLSGIFGKNLSLVDLFQYPTISALSQLLSKETPGGGQEDLELGAAQSRAELRSELRQRRQGLAKRTGS